MLIIDVLDESIQQRLESSLPAALPKCRWFGSKSRHIRQVKITDTIPFPPSRNNTAIVIFNVEYTEGKPEAYALPVKLSVNKEAQTVLKKNPNAVIYSFRNKPKKGIGVVYDALVDKTFCSDLINTVLLNGRIAGPNGDLVASLAQNFKNKAAKRVSYKRLAAKPLKAEQSNTSINFGNKFIFKLFRRVEEGTNPDVEIGLYLTDFSTFNNSPENVGTLEYIRLDRDPVTLGSLSTFVINRGDAWKFFTQELTKYYKKQLRKPAPRMPKKAYIDSSLESIPREVVKTLKPFSQMAALLGRRTAEMHLGLAANTQDERFKPEPFTLEYQERLFESMKQHTNLALHILTGALDSLNDGIRDTARRLIDTEKTINARFKPLLKRRLDSLKIRTHGDFHLGQVLFTGRDFIIIDFEGEPARPLADRKTKLCPLRDVAGMLRSFHYASHVAMLEFKKKDAQNLEPWQKHWHHWVCVSFLKSYLDTSKGAAFLPKDFEDLKLLLDVYLLEKALYELVYEINNRPNWIKVPLLGINSLLETKL